MKHPTRARVLLRMGLITAPLKGNTVSKLAEYWKSILAFLSLVSTNVAANLMDGGQPWPQNGGEWARFGITTAAGTWLVWAKRNKDKQPEVTV